VFATALRTVGYTTLSHTPWPIISHGLIGRPQHDINKPHHSHNKASPSPTFHSACSLAFFLVGRLAATRRKRPVPTRRHSPSRVANDNGLRYICEKQLRHAPKARFLVVQQSVNIRPWRCISHVILACIAPINKFNKPEIHILPLPQNRKFIRSTCLPNQFTQQDAEVSCAYLRFELGARVVADHV
jgi:hypothetical protein